jgi:hypothetical protein
VQLTRSTIGPSSSRGATADLIDALGATGGDARTTYGYLADRHQTSALNILLRTVYRVQNDDLRRFNVPAYVVRHTGKGCFEAALAAQGAA